MSRPVQPLFDRVAELTELYLRDEISDPQFAELQALVCEDERAAAAMRTVLVQAGTMRVVFTEQQQFAQNIGEVDHGEYLRLLQTLAPTEEPEPVHLIGSIDARRPWWQQWPIVIPSGMAALLAIAVTLTIALSGSTTTPNPDQITGNPYEPDRIGPGQPQVVATLTAEHDAQWAEGASAPGSPLRAGDRLTLTQGFAEITTNDGAIAILQAPATIELLDNKNAIYLHTGKLVGICETPSSKGFVVETPHLAITDLGTRFGIQAKDDATEVHVFEGEVEAIRSNSPGTQPVTLVANMSARTSADTDVIARIDHDAERFAALLPTTIQLPGTGQGLAVGDSDPNWQIVAIDGKTLDTPQLLRVTNSRFYNQHFANDPATSQWLAYEPAEQAGDEHTYLVRTTLDLPQGVSESGVRLRLTYMADNALRSVTANGHRVVLPDASWLNEFDAFQHATIDRHLVPGTNTFEFELHNIRQNGVLSATGLRVAWELSDPSAQPDRTQPSPR